MFDTIIVGVDGREGGRDALALAGLLERKFDSALVAVVAYPYDPFPSRASSRAFDAIVARDATQAAHDEVRAAGVHARAIAVSDSSPARALHHVAESEHADLIVVGSSRRSALGRQLPGTTAERLLRDAPCAVAVAPRDIAAETFAGSASPTTARATRTPPCARQSRSRSSSALG